MRNQLTYFFYLLFLFEIIHFKLMKDNYNQEKKDLNHKRLNQYKILEEKAKEKEQIGSNEEFLLSSNIKVDINTDCENEIDRLRISNNSRLRNLQEEQKNITELEIQMEEKLRYQVTIWTSIALVFILYFIVSKIILNLGLVI